MSPLTRAKRRPGSVPARPDRKRARGDLRRGGTPRPSRGTDAKAATLESKLLTAWAALAAGYPIECPVCSGPYTADEGCSRCGSKLS